ncbi:pumilio 15-like [Pyrus ussuriensis x Pyrus communis]|uniref:S-protein homolog n=1 Tax=Pyrus ussuriensis x Pyrus communis TaxID=2448454 RepID=A0A5N5FFE5_9ROSA|nr:pumilio 15-like [Pyrus ussuriensis x Pyrus communis]
MKKMSPHLRNVVMLLLVIVLMTRTEGGLRIPKRKHVRITNSLESKVDLTVHCKSGDDDLGEQKVPPTENFEFSFKTNFGGTTLFFCSFEWSNEFHWFEVYSSFRDCKYCYWDIFQDGPCMYGTCYRWKKSLGGI